MSNQNAVGGTQGNVTSDKYDFGFAYMDGTRYLRFLELGIRPGANTVLWGVKVNDTILPQGQGIVVTPNVNWQQYGNVQPQLPGSNLFYALPRNQFPVVAYRNNVSVFVTANGTPIASGATSIAGGGILIETGLAA